MVHVLGLRCFLRFICSTSFVSDFHYRLGQVENAKKHLFLSSRQPDPVEVHKMEQVERYLERCAESRKIGDWKSALRESDAAIAAGADSSPLVCAFLLIICLVHVVF